MEDFTDCSKNILIREDVLLWVCRSMGPSVGKVGVRGASMSLRDPRTFPIFGEYLGSIWGVFGKFFLLARVQHANFDHWFE